MMQGITILETIYHYEPLIPFNWFLISGITDIIICFIGVIAPTNHSIQKLLSALVTIATITVILTGALSCTDNKDKIKSIDYKVKIEDNVTLGELNEHYTIKSVEENNIYIVQEKK